MVGAPADTFWTRLLFFGVPRWQSAVLAFSCQRGSRVSDDWPLAGRPEPAVDPLETIPCPAPGMVILPGLVMPAPVSEASMSLRRRRSRTGPADAAWDVDL